MIITKPINLGSQFCARWLTNRHFLFYLIPYIKMLSNLVHVVLNLYTLVCFRIFFKELNKALKSVHDWQISFIACFISTIISRRLESPLMLNTYIGSSPNNSYIRIHTSSYHFSRCFCLANKKIALSDYIFWIMKISSNKLITFFDIFPNWK